MKNIVALFILVFTLFLVQCQSPQKMDKHVSVGPLIKLASAVRVDSAVAEAKGHRYAIATQGIYATKAAKYIFAQGGNAMDAALAASFTLAVERPHSTGLGGGGFMLFREGKSQKVYAIDFRERAPMKATTDMFIGTNGEADPKKSQNGILASAVPGLVKGLIEIHKKFGTLPLSVILKPAITLAEKGFPIYPSLSKALIQKAPILALDPEARKIFLNEKSVAKPLGSILIQSDLALTLKRIAQKGADGFYKGPVARNFVEFSKKSKGLITYADMEAYQVKWREPLKSQYKGHDIYSMPPPSSGGVHVIQFLNMLEQDNLIQSGFLSANSIHLAASALQSAFSDRARYLGDPDFTNVPTLALISKKYAQIRRSQFGKQKARAAGDVGPGDVLPFSPEHTETTHLSVMDANGDTVSTTQTINGYMGASIVVPGTGIVLNNEMDDFTAQIGASNLFGAIGGSANTIMPRKTPLSSMSPTIVVKDGVSEMSLGAPGGTRIISCVAQTILNYLEFKLPLFESVAAVRYHHQWKPDTLDIDPPGPGAETTAELLKMGYNVKLEAVPCNVMAVAHEGETFHAVADPRDIGTSAAE